MARSAVVEVTGRWVRSLDAVQAAALVVAVAAVVVGAAYAPSRFAAVNRDARRLAALTPDERHLLPARSVDLDPRVYVLARRLIPADARYVVLTGKGVQVSTPVTYLAAPAFAGFYLMPRVEVSDPRQAQWAISYGGDLAALHVPIRRRFAAAPGIELAELGS